MNKKIIHSAPKLIFLVIEHPTVNNNTKKKNIDLTIGLFLAINSNIIQIKNRAIVKKGSYINSGAKYALPFSSNLNAVNNNKVKIATANWI